MEKLILTNLSLEDLAAELAEKVNDINNKTYQNQSTAIKHDDFLTIKQASEIINLAVPTIYALTCHKKIPYFKKGKKVYFKRSELEAWICSGKKSPDDNGPISTSSLFLRNKRK